MKPGVQQANAYVGSYGIKPQADGEGDKAFRERVAGVLRGLDKIVEAHEVVNNARFDAEDSGTDVLDGVKGAMAQVLNHHELAPDDMRQVGDDIAVGGVLKAEKMSPDEMMLAMLLFGRR